ncbi:unnamed protein product [Camellia sinensis]
MSKAAQGAEAVELDRLIFRIENGIEWFQAALASGCKVDRNNCSHSSHILSTLRDVKVISELEESYRLEKFWFSKYGYVNNDEKYFTSMKLMWMLTPNGMIHHGANSLAIGLVDFCYEYHQSDNGCVVTKLPECRRRTGLSLPGSAIISRLLGKEDDDDDDEGYQRISLEEEFVFEPREIGLRSNWAYS